MRRRRGQVAKVELGLKVCRGFGHVQLWYHTVAYTPTVPWFTDHNLEKG